MPELGFEELRTERDALRSYVLSHADSVFAFRAEGHPWFRRQEKPDESDSPRKIRHITTTASCIESLHDVPLYEGDDPPAPCPAGAEKAEKIKADRDAILAEFTKAALEADADEWQSEMAAKIYCRVRTLPVLLRHAEESILKSLGPTVLSHLEMALDTVDIGNAEAQGVSELPVDSSEPSPRQGYPPNAFHTYWTIRLIREYRARGSLLPPVDSKLTDREAVAQLWARRTLAAHTALISAKQPTFDAHQLAWALSADVLCRAREDDRPTTGDRQHVELYTAALKAFFGEQKDGRWPLYEPLFHYPAAGNAYCYTYETLAELLRLALHKAGGRVLREQLRPYAANLIEAWRYARSTALPLENGGWGWCSGHHPHRTEAEAWATASVFSYLQNLRCLIGHWTAEVAERDLEVRPPGKSAPDALEMLSDRGDSWPIAGSQTVGRQLSMLFLNPIDATRAVWPTIDHDRPLIDESRSAVLFGPPGTAKTTLVESLAGCLSWNYVEVHASDFLSEGMDSVPAKADEIFTQLMELDHCVILFDEIDELIRVRDSGSSAPFGRFLTTSMLPKLAKLWNQRRVLFFVATNDIEAADPAIKRSQRFDAAMFVTPPAFEKKMKRLKKLGVTISLTAEEVEDSLAEKRWADPDLGVFALLRWDQLDDLARRICVGERGSASSDEALRGALRELGEELGRTDWQPSKGERGDGSAAGNSRGAHPHRQMFKKWKKQALNERRDYRNAAVLRLSDELGSALPDGWKVYDPPNTHFVEQDALVEATLRSGGNGVLELDGGSWKALDKKGLFFFERP
jgi:ATPase family associated with various cellular activities (AAA)